MDTYIITVYLVEVIVFVLKDSRLEALEALRLLSSSDVLIFNFYPLIAHHIA
jgi:hypothetical protein